MQREVQVAAPTIRQLQNQLLAALGIDTKQATRVDIVFDAGQLPKATVTRVLMIDGELVKRVEAMSLKFTPAAQQCPGPDGVMPLDRKTPIWICGLSLSPDLPGSHRCAAALHEACGSEAPQCPLRASQGAESGKA